MAVDYTLPGLQILNPDQGPTTYNPAQLRITLPDGVTGLSFSYDGEEGDDRFLASIDTDLAEPILLNGVAFLETPPFAVDEIKLELFELFWSVNSTTILQIVYNDYDGPESETFVAEHLFVLDGDPLPALNDEDDQDAFESLIVGADFVSPDIAAGQPIDISAAPGVQIEAREEPEEPDVTVILGDQTSETLLGTNGPDSIDALGGNDRLIGGTGNDTLLGGLGDDTILDGRGTDILNGGDGSDTYERNYADDFDPQSYTITAHLQRERLFFDDDDDDFDALISIENVLLSGDFDILAIGTGDANRLETGIGDDTLYGVAGDDTLIGNAGVDLLGGGPGDDHLFGGDGADSLFGAGDNDTLEGGAGNDLLGGAAGNDSLIGGAGDDEIWTSAGDDYAEGGIGADTLGGALGDDTLLGGDGADEIWGAAGNDSLSGGDGADLIGGSFGADTIDGGGGADEIWGADGGDSLTGGLGNDQLGTGRGDDTAYGGGGDDRIFGGLGDDLLLGDAGDDTIYGAVGSDTITGGAGNDEIFAGPDADTIFFSVGDDADTIRFFTPGSGMREDVLYLDPSFWVGHTSGLEVVQAYGSTDGTDWTLDFGNGDSVIFAGLGALSEADLGAAILDLTTF